MPNPKPSHYPEWSQIYSQDNNKQLYSKPRKTNWQTQTYHSTTPLQQTKEAVKQNFNWGFNKPLQPDVFQWKILETESIEEKTEKEQTEIQISRMKTLYQILP